MSADSNGNVTPIHFTIAGRMDDARYQQAKALAESLSKLNKYTTVELVPLVEVDWVQYLRVKKTEFGEAAWTHKHSPIIFYNGCNYIGSAEEFETWASRVFKFKTVPNSLMFSRKAKTEFNAWLSTNPHSFCYMDLGTSESCLGRVVVELYDDVCPKTCQNFMNLCTSEAEGKPQYRGTPIHRVVKGGWIQGGDTEGGHGDGGKSSFGDTFEDESFEVLHDRPGILGMANTGPHTNGSQFYIIKDAAPFLDQKKVAFGRVISGMRAISLLENVDLLNQRPIDPITVTDCGSFPLTKLDNRNEAKESAKE